MNPDEANPLRSVRYITDNIEELLPEPKHQVPHE
jgi:hypothetical protein